MGDQTQAYDIFQTPLSSGYPLPLMQIFFLCSLMDMVRYRNMRFLSSVSIAGCPHFLVFFSVAELRNFGTDPDPWIPSSG